MSTPRNRYQHVSRVVTYSVAIARHIFQPITFQFVRVQFCRVRVWFCWCHSFSFHQHLHAHERRPMQHSHPFGFRVVGGNFFPVPEPSPWTVLVVFIVVAIVAAMRAQHPYKKTKRIQAVVIVVNDEKENNVWMSTTAITQACCWSPQSSLKGINLVYDCKRDNDHLQFDLGFFQIQIPFVVQAAGV